MANYGRLTQKKNWQTTEEENYTYDSLGRLATAYTTGPEWGLSFVYDGFGNRLQQNVTKGTAPSTVQTVDPLTNRLNGAGFGYDSNGNMTGWSTPSGSVTASYDVENRMTQIVTPSVTETYAYGPGNLRVKKYQGGAWTYTVYGQGGEVLGTYSVCTVSSSPFLCQAKLRVYFGGRLVVNGWTGVKPDRLGSPDGTHGRVYPYGEVSGSVSVDQDETFTTYKRDVYTGLDYAQNRYYASSWGRFTTADPYRASAGQADPQSWNRYAYVVNDPVSLLDPTGRQAAAPTGQACTIIWYSLMFDVVCNGSSGTDGGGGGGGGDTLVSNVYAFADPDPPNESAPEGSDPDSWDWRPQGGSESAGSGDGGGGGGGGAITRQQEQILPCLGKGIAVGAAGAAAVGLVAVGAVTIGAPVAVVTGVLGVVSVIGASSTMYYGYQKGKAGDWGGAAYDVGSLIGASLVGGAGARWIRTGITGETHGWSWNIDASQRYVRDFPGGSFGKWLGTGPNIGSAGGSAAAAGAGLSQVVSGGC